MGKDEDQGALTIQRVATGLYQTQALYVAAKLGIADHLQSGALDAGELARLTGVDPDRLGRVLRYLCMLGVFEQDGGGRFSNNAAGRELLTAAHGSMKDYALIFGEEFYTAWANLLTSVTTGQDAFSATFGQPLFEYLANRPERAEAFDRAMAGGGAFFRALPRAYDFSAAGTLVDVGGGSGAALAAILAANPELRGIVFDADRVLARAESHLRAAGVFDRCRLVAGDFFESELPQADLFMLSRILHDWTDEQCRVILSACRSSIADDGRLLVVERLIPGPLALGADLNMMAVTTGRERTIEELRCLLGESGFEFETVRPLPLELNLVVGRPSGASG